MTHVVSNLDELLLNVVEGCSDSSLDSNGDGLLDHSRSNSLDKLIQQVVLGISDGEFKSIEGHVDVNNLR
jgi:hypothetical protein